MLHSGPGGYHASRARVVSAPSTGDNTASHDRGDNARWRRAPAALLVALLAALAVVPLAGCSGRPYKWIVDAEPTVFFVRDCGTLYQIAEARIAYWLPKPATFKGRVEVEDLSTRRVVSTDIGDVGFGDRKGYRVRVPDVSAPTRFAFRLFDAGAPGLLQNEIVKDWVPQRKWTVTLVPGSHIDLYSTANADLTPEQHRRILDTACDLCDQYPGYTFQLENRIPIYEYLDGSRSPGQVDRLMRLIRDGRIDVGAQYTGIHQMSGSGESYIQGQMVPWNQGVDLEKKYGVKPEFCAVYDTPGVIKQLPEFLRQNGVRYLVYAPNTSYRIQELMGLPYIFRWKTESGASVTTWRTSFGYNQEKMAYFRLTDPDPRVREDSVNRKLLQRQKGLDESGKPNGDLAYPYDRYLIPWDYGDNEPADAGPVLFTESWNSKWEYPRFEIGSYAGFLGEMEKRYGDALPERRGELANCWEYVVMNQGVINLYDRFAQRTLPAAQGLWALAFQAGVRGYPGGKFQEAWDNLAKVEAHDFFYGAKLDPDTGELVLDLMNPDWAKAEWSLIAEKKARETEESGLAALTSLIDCGGSLKLAVYNPLSHSRSDPVVVRVPDGLADGRFTLRDDAGGAEIPYQLIDAATYQDCFGRRPSMKNQDRHFGGAYPDPEPPSGMYAVFIARDVPGIGYRTYSVFPCAEPPSYPGGPAAGPGTLENEHYHVEFDGASGQIKSIIDRDLSRELVDADARLGGGRMHFNQFVRGTMSLDSASILINMPPFCDNRPLWQPVLDMITRNSVKNWQGDFFGGVRVAASGPVMSALVVTGKDLYGGPRRQSVVLYQGVKRIDMVNWVERAGGSAFGRWALAYPLALGGGFDVRYHNPYSVVKVGGDELPGPPSPHRHLGDWIEFRGGGLRVALSSPDVGPFTLGRADLNLVDDARYTVPEKPYYFPVYLDTCAWSAFVVPGSYAMRFSLNSAGVDEGDVWAHRFGSSFATPLKGAFVSGSGPLAAGESGLLTVDDSCVDIAAVKKAGNGRALVLRLVETVGAGATVTVTVADLFTIKRVSLAGLDERPTLRLPHSHSQVSLDVPPHGITTLRLELARD